MPLPISLAHKLAHRLAEVRKGDVVPYLRPDGKTQVTVRYENGRPIEIEKVLISTQHKDGIDSRHADPPRPLGARRSHPILPAELYDERKLNTKQNFLVNPTGRFVIGGPVGDAGLTGRKIIVDTYGGMARHGGGAFSGKDPSKVDRSAAYAARWVAKNVVAAGLADRCEVQVAYAIGVAHPVSVMVETFGTEKISRVARSPSSSTSTSTCGPGSFREELACTGRSTRRPPPTATSAATTTTSPGSAPTAPSALRDAAGLAAATPRLRSPTGARAAAGCGSVGAGSSPRPVGERRGGSPGRPCGRRRPGSATPAKMKL